MPAATRGPTSQATTFDSNLATYDSTIIIFDDVGILGDADVAHCSAMTRAEGSINVFVNNQPWSCKDDKNTNHDLPGDPCPKHQAAITTGSTIVFVNGDGAGRIGDVISGCTSVAAGSSNVFAGP